MTQIKSIGFGSLILFFIIGLNGITTANEILVQPNLIVRGEYDDNIAFDQNNEDEVDDFGVSVRPSLVLGYNTESYKAQVIGDIDYLFYKDESDFNRLNMKYEFDGQYYLSGRSTLLGTFEFTRLESIESQLGETGRTFDEEGVDRFSGSGGIQYQLTERSNITPELRYLKTVYNDSDSYDNEVFTLSTPYELTLRNQRDKLTFEPDVGYFESNIQEAYNAQFTAEWERLISERTTFSINLGPRYTHSKLKKNNTEENNFGGVGGLFLSHTGDTFSGSADFNHSLYPDADGALVNRSRLKIDFNQNFSDRFGFRFSGTGIYSFEDQGDGEKVWYSRLIPSFFYLITPNSFLELGYSYQNQIELSEPGNPETHRNKVFLTYNISFPMNW